MEAVAKVAIIRLEFALPVDATDDDAADLAKLVERLAIGPFDNAEGKPFGIVADVSLRELDEAGALAMHAALYGGDGDVRPG